MKKFKIAALLLACAILLPFAVPMSAVAVAEAASNRDLPVHWNYKENSKNAGKETTVTIPSNVDIVRAGSFFETPVKTVIINHDVMLCGNTFIGAYHLTDIYFYSRNSTHLFSLYNGTPCKYGSLVCMDDYCIGNYGHQFITTILTGSDLYNDNYVAKTLTIHGYKGSTAEKFVETLNAHPEKFILPQKVVFKPIEETQKGTSANTTSKNNSVTTAASANQTSSNTNTKKEYNLEIKNNTHVQGTKGTTMYIADFNGVTYPRRVYMKLGSYYIMELGNVPNGYSYDIEKLNSNLCTLDTKTGEIRALQKGTVTVNLRLKYPNGKRAVIPCKVYIE